MNVTPLRVRMRKLGIALAQRDAVWLGRKESNLRMAESKSAALPLGYAPMAPRRPPGGEEGGAEHSGCGMSRQPSADLARHVGRECDVAQKGRMWQRQPA